ncbi:GNAT family protein [uncultured Psychrobacillus sp.]|uniref:GNAT family N-acetyltransferase n=1 Tax=uncultured Psychrobacillus sp. TaxID=1551585 RepID=UPI002627C3C9|nr:GNAT family protein [uncultured Psychrobacillus sp.]
MTFSFTKLPIIETERLILRKATEQDSDDILELYANENVVEHMPLDPFTSIEDAKGEISWYEKIFLEQTGLRWVIEEKVNKKVIGTCGYLNYEVEHNRIEIGYDLSPESWGKGIMTETLKAVIHFAFSELNVNKIEAQITSENDVSLHLVSKLGFHRDGVLREHEFEKGRYIDLVIYSLLAREYTNKPSTKL